jgi:sec-independent protein translocase protein TatA
MLPHIGPLEIIIILLIVVLLFGVGRIGKIGGELGRGIREFRKAVQDEDKDKTADKTEKIAEPATKDETKAA